RGLFEHSLIGNLKRIAGLPKTARLFWQLPGRGEAKRDFYANALSQQNGDWFKPRADACPICGSEDLQRFIASHDVLLVKPGHFTLDECRSCGHIFQNPQLTDEGLSFYYQDA